MTPRRNESKFKIPGYDYLKEFPDRPGIYYQRYSPEKRDTFTYSTGLDDPREASRVGKKEYDKWLGLEVDRTGPQLIRDFARVVLAAKEGKKGGKNGSTYQSAANQINNHIIPAFGHLRPDQITPLRWDVYDADERKRIHKRKIRNKAGKVIREVEYLRTALTNTRIILMEILRRAQKEGHRFELPELKNNDPKPAPPRYIPKATMLALIRAAGRSRRTGKRGRRTKLLAYLMWKQGPRPEEALQYRFDMIQWEEGPTGTIHIPGSITKTGRARAIPLNSKVSRLLRWLAGRSRSPWLFPSQSDPKKRAVEYKTGWNSACRRIGVDFIPYNCRDTFITNSLRRGLSSTFIGKYCDNSPLMIDKHYAVALQEELGRVAG